MSGNRTIGTNDELMVTHPSPTWSKAKFVIPDTAGVRRTKHREEKNKHKEKKHKEEKHKEEKHKEEKHKEEKHREK